MRTFVTAEVDLLLPSHEVVGDIRVSLVANDDSRGEGWRMEWAQHRVSGAIALVATREGPPAAVPHEYSGGRLDDYIGPSWRIAGYETVGPRYPEVAVALAVDAALTAFGTETVRESLARQGERLAMAYDFHRKEILEFDGGWTVDVLEWRCAERDDDPTRGTARFRFSYDGWRPDCPPDIYWRPGRPYEREYDALRTWDFRWLSPDNEMNNAEYVGARIDKEIQEAIAQHEFLVALRAEYQRRCEQRE